MPLENKSGNGSGGGPWGGDPGKGAPKNPWGPPPKPPSGDGPGDGGKPGGGGGGNNNGPDFDAFIKRSQERLRASLNGGGSKLGGVRHNIPWAYIIGGLVALWIAFTSTYQVGPKERGVVQRFGRYIETTGPGLHVKLPSPIDEVTKLAVETINQTLIGGAEGKENLILTGDKNIINMSYQVRWKINDPVKYLFELAEPETTVDEVAESAMRSEVGRVSFDAVVGPQRAQIADQVRDRMQELLTSYKSGIEVVGVDILHSSQPTAVDEAFKQVSAAQQDAQRFQNEANTYSQQITNRAQGETAIFDKLYAQYKLAPEVTRRRLYYETMEDVLGKNATTVIEPRGVTPYLPVPARILPDTAIAAKGAAR